jgi:hypothetical protein
LVLVGLGWRTKGARGFSGGGWPPSGPPNSQKSRGEDFPGVCPRKVNYYNTPSALFSSFRLLIPDLCLCYNPAASLKFPIEEGEKENAVIGR